MQIWKLLDTDATLDSITDLRWSYFADGEDLMDRQTSLPVVRTAF